MSATGAKRYFDDALVRGDYYLEGQEFAGSWGGRAAAMLGLEGEVSREAFHQLCDNINPTTGDRLTARTRTKRRVGYDFNFHCPKTVSAVYALTGDERIMTAFRAGVQETMLELEQDTECRVRDNGQHASRTTGNMLWSEFVHLTTRPVDGVPDPHLHAHCFVQNVTFDSEHPNRDGTRGMWKAGDFASIKRDARYFEAGFHARFAGRMAQMGYEVQRDGKGYWDIAGIPASVKDKFSRRTVEITELAQKLGITDPNKIAELGATSRQAKDKGMTMEALRQTWDNSLTPEERNAIHKAESDADGTARAPQIDAAESLTYGIHHVFERNSVVSERALAEQALRHGVGSVSVEGTWQRVAGLKDTGTLMTGTQDGSAMVTTREVLSEEKAMIAFARDGRGACSALGSPAYRFDDPLFRDPASDTAEQEEAIREVLASHDRVIAVRGGAGTGKTTLMREVANGIEQHGHQIFAFAPTADASRTVLRDEGFADANTVEHLLRNRELQQRVRGQVLWIDEAGLLGAQSMNRIFRLAKAQGCRVILTGDTKQHAPVARGDAMRILEDEGGIVPIAITKIQRQRVRDRAEPKEITRYRQAVEHLSKGDPARGLKALEEMDAVVEFDIDVTAEERCQQIAQDYLQALQGRNLKGERNEVLAVSPTHAEGDAVTRNIREGLQQAGVIKGKDRTTARLVNLNWTEPERGDASKYQPGQIIQFEQNVKGGFTRGQRFTVTESAKGEVSLQSADGSKHSLPLVAAARFTVYEERKLALAKGDRIRITKNGFTSDGKHRLNNGAMYEVKGFTPSGDIRLNNDWKVDSTYGHLTHGYVTTSHSSQGKTADVVLIAQSAQSLAASSMEQFYVSVSRGREQVRIYTDDKEGLREAIGRSGQRLSATELVGDKQPEPARERRRTRKYRRVIARRNRTRQRKDYEQTMDRG